MSTYENLDTETFVSGASLNGNLYKLVALDAGNPSAVVLATAEDDYCIGVLAQDPKRSKLDDSSTAGDAVTVAKLKGQVPVVCGASVTAGHFVHATAAGAVISAGGAGFADLTAGDFILGKALKTGATGEVITILAQPFYAGAAV